MITHDLRTPLAMAIGYAELLCANYPSPLSEEQANYARSILENTRRAVDLIGSLSEAFAAISGDLVLDRGWVDLSQLIREVTEELQAYLAQRKQNLQPINESGVRWILADKPRLAKALQLLLRFVARELPAVKVFRLHIAHTANEIDQLVLTLQATRHSSNGEEIFSRSLRQRRNRSLPILIATAFIEAHGGRLIWPDPGAQGVIARIHLPLDPG
ncbi:MAG TPA: hypothetical protein G4O02_07990 [Caldilineae bacterium]|nr:hypothetical protein [Caldilineae bacterium]